MTVRLAAGQSIAERFTLVRQLAVEAPQEIWQALDTRLHEPAILRLVSLHPDQVERLRNLASVERGRNIAHEALLRTYWIELVDGELLAIASEGREELAPIDWQGATRQELLLHLTAVIDALQYLHNLGYAHGLISRWTILQDGSGRSYLTEFGAAPAARSVAEQDAPELALTDDIHALGTLLFEAATGLPWSPAAPLDEQLARLAEQALPTALVTLIARMLRPAPYERPRTIDEVAAVLRDLAEAEGARIRPARAFERGGSGLAGTDGAPLPRLNTPISRRETSVMPATTAAALFTLLVLLLAGVVLLLPATLDEEEIAEGRFEAPPVRVEARPTGGEPTASGPAPFEAAMAEHLREEADQLATELLRQQVYLEDIGVMLWNPSAFEEARASGERGDSLFKEERFDEALDQFNEGISLLTRLEESVPQEFDDALRRGRQALSDGDAAAAAAAFEIVRAIDPENEEAALGLARSETLDEVFELIADAERAEGVGDLATALAQYREALSIDQEMSTARAAIARVREAIRQRDFQQAMSRGLAALNRGEFEEARDAFEAAERLAPDAVAPRDGLEQVELALRSREIEKLRIEAREAESAEEWQRAHDAYAAVVELDGSLLFATEGRARAAARSELDAGLQQFLDNPDLLTVESNLRIATALLDRARAITNRGARIERQATGLAELVRLTRVPVDVVIRSDKLTEVTVYRVGRLGRIDATTLQLYPGTYRAIGSRRGYRDQLVEFEIVPGRTPLPVEVRCTEKI